MALRNKVIVVIDCNWYISASINKKSRRMIFKIITGQYFKVVYSEELLEEYREVIKRDKFKKIIKLSQANRFIEFLKTRIIEIKVKDTPNVSRDRKDDYLLALAKAANANFLITGDLDLLTLGNHFKTRVITMKQFIETTN